MTRLWEAIFRICRLDQPDPVAAWQRHAAELAARRDYLNAKRYTALKYTAPATNFTLGLPDHHLWHGGESQTPQGTTFIANVPTEEVYTMPHKERADGVVSSTKPLSYGGVLIEDFSLTYEQGRVVKVTAKKGEAVLQKLIETDEGSARLGEVALVPHSSPISQSGLLFYNTLFDENASNHIALGRAYRFCLEDGTHMTDEEFAAAGGNDSLTHVDFMIGSADMDVDGLTRDGVVEAVMRGGEWAF
jgi:aminopeptidase